MGQGECTARLCNNQNPCGGKAPVYDTVVAAPKATGRGPCAQGAVGAADEADEEIQRTAAETLRQRVEEEEEQLRLLQQKQAEEEQQRQEAICLQQQRER